MAGQVVMQTLVNPEVERRFGGEVDLRLLAGHPEMQMRGIVC